MTLPAVMASHRGASRCPVRDNSDVTQRSTPTRPTTAAVVLASGAGSRIGSEINKAYLPLAGRPLVTRSLEMLATLADTAVLVLVTRSDDAEHVETALAATNTPLPIEIITGGSDRQESELFALRHLRARVETGSIDTVLLHDAARPLATAELSGEVVRLARVHGGAVPGMECGGLAVASSDGEYLEQPLTMRTVRAQTPQGFRATELCHAYEAAALAGFSGTDTASCVERFSDLSVHWVPGEPDNIKITYWEDVRAAERILARKPPDRV